ncbi:MAG TPA: sulfurtransferase TusA family protein [Longimicrobiales bacterium]|nr:sulfurtransferase TusA family protein [Longimicrobiales bacterium]
MTPITAAQTLDARGLLCPMPVVKAAKAIRTIEVGQVLRVLATDRGALADFPAWADDTGNELVDMREEDGVITIHIKRLPEED